MSPFPVRGFSQLRDTEVGAFDTACRLGAGPGTWTGNKKSTEKQNQMTNRSANIHLQQFRGIPSQQERQQLNSGTSATAAKHPLLATSKVFPTRVSAVETHLSLLAWAGSHVDLFGIPVTNNLNIFASTEPSVFVLHSTLVCLQPSSSWPFNRSSQHKAKFISIFSLT